MNSEEIIKLIAEFATIFGVFVAIVGVSIAVWTFKQEIKKQTHESKRQREILQLTFFAEYTKRYQEILLHLPENLTDDIVLTDAEKKYLRAYFDLCSEEYFLHENKHIDEKAWKTWKDGMKIVFDNMAIANYWKTKTKFSSEIFCNFVENDLLKISKT